ncbi:hypothetical protein CR513_06610, partial [Mucuna pruriens]
MTTNCFLFITIFCRLNALQGTFGCYVAAIQRHQFCIRANVTIDLGSVNHRSCDGIGMRDVPVNWRLANGTKCVGKL